jgi:putative ubiquitin-RnfH superfamily antitoxin RatB of RatAB toxin-antitoxin module
MENSTLIQQINNIMAITLPEQIAFDQLQVQLAAHINELIKNDFQGLLFLLYKIDVDEKKLKAHLSANAQEASGNIIAGLIIERIIQREQSKKQFSNKPAADDTEEKW